MSIGHACSSKSLVQSSDEDAVVVPSPETETRELAAHGPSGADPLSDVLRTVRLTGALFFLTDAASPWAMELPAASTFAPIILPGAQRLISYHIVTNGSCWGGLVGEPPVRLEAGDILLIPHGDPYVMSIESAIAAEQSPKWILEFFRQMAAGELPFVVTEGGGGSSRVQLACGFLGCDARPFNPVLTTLPRLVHLRRPRSGADRLDHLIDFALAESSQPRSGGQCVLLRLSELMFIEVVRRYLASLPAQETGWLAGLQDPVVGRALCLLHRSPAQRWTVENLAKEAGFSRSGLADRFTHFIGQPPMQYLAHWRMQLAASLLADGAAKVCAVALNVGYDSEAAFSRAFKKIVGASPAAWRKRTSGAMRLGV